MYCVSLRPLLAVAGLILIGGSPAWPAGAPIALHAPQQAGAPAAPPPAAPSAPAATAPTQPSTFADFLTIAIAQQTAQAATEQDKAWLPQLKAFYEARGGKPVWLAENTWNTPAQQVMAELAKAADWGLDPAAFPIPALAPAARNEEQANAELGLSRAVVKYASHARGGRIPHPQELSLWLARTDDPVVATQVLTDIVSNADAAAALRAMHPQTEDFNLLRQAYVSMRYEIEHPKQLDPADVIPMGDRIKLGQSHADVQIIRRRLKLPGEPGLESQFDEKLANAIGKYMDERDVEVRWGRIDDKVRRVFNRPPPAPSKDDMQRILANMERWRWLPRDLGKLHIWNNLPEYMTRVVKDGVVIHQERIIVGQPDTQTPVFTDMMRQVVFQPEWGVPPSIKINDLLPKLQAGDYEVLERRNMRILGLTGRQLRPQRFNWDKVDIRDVGIYQRSGGANPLGRVKFLFPNQHHVYMHDTNNRSLFKSQERTFSHGCVRVRNPERLAEILLAEDRGWDKEKVKDLLNDWDTPNNKIDLERPFPVHNVYFTYVPGPNHTLIKLDDIYDHDKRVIQALSGVPFSRIAANDPARSQQRELDEAAPPMVRKALRERQSGDDE